MENANVNILKTHYSSSEAFKLLKKLNQINVYDTKELKKHISSIRVGTGNFYDKKAIDKCALEFENTVLAEEYLDILNNKTNGFLVRIIDKKSPIYGLKLFLKKHKIKYLPSKTDINPTLQDRYYLSEVDSVVNAVRSFVKIYNVEGSPYNVDYETLSVDMLNEHYYPGNVADDIMGCRVKFATYSNIFNLVKIGVYYYIRKECLDKYYNMKNSVISIPELAKEITKQLTNETITVGILFEYLQSNNYNIVMCKETPFLLANSVYISDVDAITKFFVDRNKFKNIKTAYGKIKFYINENPSSNTQIKETLKEFEKFALKRSNAYSNTTAMFNALKEVYQVLNFRLKSELKDISQEEYIDINRYMLEFNTSLGREEFNKFYVSIKQQEEDTKEIIIQDVKKRDDLDSTPYPFESFVETFVRLIEYINSDEGLDSIIKSRRYASLCLYIMMHYVTIWRTKDIFSMPSPNLSLIGFNSGKEFLEWLKESTEPFSLNMGRLVCTDIERKVKMLRKRAKKNKGKLIFIIGDEIAKELGLLLCICEAHREYFSNKSKSASKDLVIASSLKREYLSDIFGDRADMLFEGKQYSNRRGNKSFAGYIQDKSEEWGLGIGYLLDSIMRGHRLNDNLISETTKIYINRDVNKVTLRLFKAGIFGGVKSKLLTLADVNYEELTPDEKVTKIQELHMTPYQIEKAYQVLAKRNNDVDNFLNNYLKAPYTKKGLVKELMYGKNSYGKHVGTKCLLRAYRETEKDEIATIDSPNYCCIVPDSESCFGCSFMIAKRIFLKEVGIRFNQTIEKLRECSSEIDKKINIDRLESIYIPLIYDAVQSFGLEEVREMIDISNVMNIINVEKERIGEVL